MIYEHCSKHLISHIECCYSNFNTAGQLNFLILSLNLINDIFIIVMLVIISFHIIFIFFASVSFISYHIISVSVCFVLVYWKFLQFIDT